MDQQDLFNSSSGVSQQEPSFWQNSKILDYMAFFLFAVLLAVGSWHHELWGDELHSWNLARGSSSLRDLFSNIRYEGHPPLWYLLLFLLSKLTGKMVMIKGLHVLIVLIGAWMLVFRMHIYSIHKILILSGYFFLYEYGVLNRNYAMAVLFAISIVLLRNRDSKYDLFFYYFLLLLISTTHILGLFLGLSLHFAFTIKHFSTWYSRQALFELAAGVLVVVPALYFIFPPSTGSLNLDFWREHWSLEQIRNIAEAPLKSFLPVPAWWRLDSWNTQFLLAVQVRFPIFKLLTFFLSCTFIYAVYYILRPHRLSLNVFFVNFFLTLFFAFFFPLSSIRYVGFIYIGFIVSLLIGYHTLIQFRKRRIMIWMLLVLQVFAAVPSFVKDLKRPFSQSGEIGELISGINTEVLVTDYWTLNYLSAATQGPLFCLGYNEHRQFLLWDHNMRQLMKDKAVYSEGLSTFFTGRDLEAAFLVSTHTLEQLLSRDARLINTFELELVDARTGSIEKHSDLYLYKVTPYVKK